MYHTICVNVKLHSELLFCLNFCTMRYGRYLTVIQLHPQNTLSSYIIVHTGTVYVTYFINPKI